MINLLLNNLFNILYIFNCFLCIFSSQLEKENKLKVKGTTIGDRKIFINDFWMIFFIFPEFTEFALITGIANLHAVNGAIPVNSMYRNLRPITTRPNMITALSTVADRKSIDS